MKAKQFTLLLGVVALIVGGCSDTKDIEKQVSTVISQVTDEATSKDSDDNTADETDEADMVESYDVDMFSNRAGIEETVLVDENNVKITATELNYDNYNPKLMLTIENNSDKELDFISGSIGFSYNSVNGYMISSAYINSTVAAGKKAMEEMYIYTDELALYGITDIADIEVAFEVKDDDYNEVLVTKPIKIATSISETYDNTVDTYMETMRNAVGKTIGSYKIARFEENTIYDQNGVQIISEGLMEGSSGEQTLVLEAKNSTDAPVILRVSDVSFNGLLVCDDNWTSETVNAGAKALIDIDITDMVDYYMLEPYALDPIAQVDFVITPLDSNYDETGNEQNITLAISDEEASYDASGEELYNSNGIRIVCKGIYEESGSLKTYKHLVLMIENNSSMTVWADANWNNLSVNGFMADYIAYSKTLAPGQTGTMDIEMTNSDLSDLGINEVADITDVELKLELRQPNYNEIDTPTLQMTF